MSSTLLTNIVSYYKFEDNSNDAVGSNNGTDTTVTYSAANGFIGHGVGFTGLTNSHISVGTINPPAVTYAGWVKVASFDSNYQAIVSISTGSIYCELYTLTNGKLAMYISATGGNLSYDGTGSHTLLTGTWYHVALTYDSVHGLVGYVNGVSDGTAAANGTIKSPSNPLWFGADPDTPRRWWHGAIDEFGIWSRAITPAEVLQLYNNGLGLQYPFNNPGASFLFNLI
jgi:hypothetical protein